MDTRLLAELEASINRWMVCNCGERDWPDCYYPPDTAELMAQAAGAVFDAIYKGQAYTGGENG